MTKTSSKIKMKDAPVADRDAIPILKSDNKKVTDLFDKFQRKSRHVSCNDVSPKLSHFKQWNASGWNTSQRKAPVKRHLFSIFYIGGINMNRDVSSNPVNSLMLFLTGAAIGGVVVALTTPKRGADLRRDLKRLGGKAKDRIEDWTESASEAMEGFTAYGKERTANITAQLRAKAEEAVDKGQDAWEEVKKGTAKAGTDMKDGLSAAAKEFRT